MHLRTSMSFVSVFVLLGMVGICGNASAQGTLGDDRDRALTPLIGVDPVSLDFGGCILVGECTDLTLEIFNEAADPTSILTIIGIDLAGTAYDFVTAPILPVDLPGDGTTLSIAVRFCPPASGQHGGDVTITAETGTLPPNPVVVPLSGVGSAAPQCDAGGPYPGMVGDQINFVGSGSGGSRFDDSIDTYAWEFGDGDTGEGSSTTHIYNAVNVYVVTLTVTDDCARTSTCETTADISEQPNQPPICNAGGPYDGLVGATIQFDGTGSSDPDGTVIAYDWNFGDGNSGSGAEPAHVYNTAMLYDVTLTVTDDDQDTSVCATTANITAEPNEPPICDAGGAYFGNEGDMIQFDGTGSSDPDGTVVSYDWDFGDGNSGNGAMPTHVYTPGGVYDVTLTVTDDDSATSTCGTIAEINGLPICDAGGPYAGNVGDMIQFDGSGSSDPEGWMVSYDWDFGDGGTGVGPMPTHVYNTGGIFNVGLAVTDTLGAVSSCGTTADINEFPICDANGPYTGIEGENINFDGTGSDDPDGQIVGYAWEFGDGDTGTGPVTVHVYDDFGTFTITLTVTDDDAATSVCTSTAEIDHSPTPVDMSLFEVAQDGEVVNVSWRTSRETANLGFHVMRGDVDLGGAQVQLNDMLIESAGLAGDYEFADDTAVAGHTYDYFLAAMGRAGGRELHGPKRVTVIQVAPSKLALHPNQPNPFNPSTTVSFDLPEAGSVSLTIYDVTGRPVRTLLAGTVAAGVYTRQWNGQNDAGQAVSSGIYFMQLRTAAGTMTRKMVMAR